MGASLVRAVIITFCTFFTISLLAVSASAAPVHSRTARHAAVTGITVAAVAVTAVRHYRVRAGDSLSKIARRAWGHASWWPRLWHRNRHRIINPNVIRAGMVLTLPRGKPPVPWVARAALRAIPRAPVHHVVLSVVHRSRHHHHARYHAAPAQPAHYSGGSGFQACVIARESGGNPRAVNPSSGAGGLYQFLPSTWASLGYASAYPGGAQTAPVSVQNAAFWKLYGEAGTSPWRPYDGC